MSKIEQLKNELGSEDNDLKALGIAKKLHREVKSVKFIEHWLPQLKKKVEVIIDTKMEKYTVISPSYGMVDFFPKSNRLLIRNGNRWFNKGLQILIAEFELKAPKLL